MPGLDWLTARPVAHRGLHDASAGIVENTASAFHAAIEAGYAIECDVQISADGEAMVFHDDTLPRLTEGTGPLAAQTAATLKSVRFRTTTDTMLTLSELCDLVGGRTPLVIEMKSGFDGDTRLPARIAEILQSYAGPVAVMSFDPDQIAALAQVAPGLPRGIVAERHYAPPDWPPMPASKRISLAFLLHALRTRPHFVAYHIKDLPAFAPLVARYLFGAPLLTWTVRSEADCRRARRWASQMIFEGFRP